MRYGPDDKFWVVIDPKPHSTLDDLVRAMKGQRLLS